MKEIDVLYDEVCLKLSRQISLSTGHIKKTTYETLGLGTPDKKCNYKRLSTKQKKEIIRYWVDLIHLMNKKE